MAKPRKKRTLSAEHRVKLAEVLKKRWESGDFDSPKMREIYSKQGKAMKGSKRTEDQKKKMSDAHKGKDVAHLHTPEAKEKHRQKLLGRHQTEESNKKRSVTLKGRKFSDKHLENLVIAVRNRVINGTHNFLQEGESGDPYPPEFGDYLKRKIRKRDNHVCQSCGTNVYKSNLGHVHHIDGCKQNCSEDNLLLLCATCHNAVHNRINITSSKIEELKCALKKVVVE